MKKHSFLLLSFLIVFAAGKGQGFKVTLKTPSYHSGLAYFTYYMGKNRNIEDSAFINSKGVAVFKGDRRLPGGIYSIVFPGKNLSVDFFINKEQQLTVLADSTKLLDIVVQGSPENVLFKQYQKVVNEKGGKMQQERTAYMASTTKKDSLLHEQNYNQYNKELNTYREKIINQHSESMMALFLNTMKEPEIIIKNPITRQDTLDNYQYYKRHYWDGITFMDERVIRTPFFLPKLERYYREIMPQAPDSIIKDLDYKLLLARTCPEMYKFLLNWLTDEYINPKYMGQDAVFVHLFNKYHSKGVSNWLNEKQLETISRRAYFQMSNLLGEKAADLEMVDSTDKPVNLYSLDANFILVAFWDPTCGHCKEEIPRIDSIYQASWKAKGVKIFAVLSEPDKKNEWIQYTKEKKLSDWTHAYQTKEMEQRITDAGKPSFRQLYDVIQTPTLYLLDKEKRIIGKKLTWKQFDDLLQAKIASQTK
jgi:thiol-disulfide isomerase/thioredoxin